MSGGGGGGGNDRDDTPTGPDVGPDACRKERRGPINSPKAAVLAGHKVGDTLDVDVDKSGAVPVLVVRSPGGAVAGSLTFNGYLEIIQCIGRGYNYEAVILSVLGGVYEVKVQAI